MLSISPSVMSLDLRVGATDYTCENNSCSKAFHSMCLVDWLRSITTTRQLDVMWMFLGFGRICNVYQDFKGTNTLSKTLFYKLLELLSPVRLNAVKVIQCSVWALSILFRASCSQNQCHKELEMLLVLIKDPKLIHPAREPFI
ncbi:hypothetical protein CRYUN_Cryun22dG0083000 [Craigia yunnanensis]